MPRAELSIEVGREGRAYFARCKAIGLDAEGESFEEVQAQALESCLQYATQQDRKVRYTLVVIPPH